MSAVLIALAVAVLPVSVAMMIAKLRRDRARLDAKSRLDIGLQPSVPEALLASPEETPYRSATAASELAVTDDELSQLAAEGRRRGEDEERRKSSEPRTHDPWVRLHRLCNSTRLLPKVFVLCQPVPSEAEFPTVDVEGDETPWAGPPSADDIEVAAQKLHQERAWVTTLPFALDGYPAVLARNPGLSSSRSGIAFGHEISLELDVKLAGEEQPPHTVLRDLFHAHDPSARVVSGSTVHVSSGPIQAYWWERREYSNALVPAYVHGVVDKVLLALYRSYPIERVMVDSAKVRTDS